MTERNNNVGPLITPTEAAAVLRISPRTLWRWQSRGHITPVRLPNGFRRFALEDIERLASNRVA